MTRFPKLKRVIAALSTRVRDEAGAALVEFAIVMALFFFIFFALIDFGRLLYTYVHAEKAAVDAVRIAVVRPAVCAGVPLRNVPPSNATVSHPRSGTSCDFNNGTGVSTCSNVTVTCNVGANSLSVNTTVVEIWSRIQGLMPPGSSVNDLTFKYEFDPRLGYLGGPFTPNVTVELGLADFQFVAPLAGLAALAAGATSTGSAWSIAYPDFSVSLPAEDLKHGG